MSGDDEPRMIPEQRLVDLVHDIRTPLTIISGFADLLRKRPDLAPEQRAEFVDRIAHAARELTDMLDDERRERHAGRLR